MEIVQIAVEIPVFIAVGRIVPHGVLLIPVVGKVRVPPVDDGEVQPRPQASLPRGIQKLPDEIPPGGGVGGLEVRVRAVIEAEAVVVFGGEDHILGSRVPDGPHPLAHITVRGVKFVNQGIIVLLGDKFLTADPLPPGGDGIEAKVDKHTKTGLGEPLHPALIRLPGKMKCHIIVSP